MFAVHIWKSSILMGTFSVFAEDQYVQEVLSLMLHGYYATC